jgi:natural resistance-associated macrophage protein
MTSKDAAPAVGGPETAPAAGAKTPTANGAAAAAAASIGDAPDQQHLILLTKGDPSSSSLASSTCAPAAAPPGGAPAAAPPPPPAFLSPGFWRTLARYVGPGFMVAMAYIDPGNLAADMNQGLAAGYTLAWVTLWCTVMGLVIQMLAAKLGVATGRHLAEHCRSHYPLAPRLALWLAAELAIVACDMVEVIGGAAALYTLSSGAIPLWAGVLITAASAFATLCLERWGMRLLEAVLRECRRRARPGCRARLRLRSCVVFVCGVACRRHLAWPRPPLRLHSLSTRTPASPAPPPPLQSP